MISINDLKEKKNQIESSYFVEKKEREKEKELLELKMTQLKDELNALRSKDKVQETHIEEINFTYNSKMKEMNHELELRTK